MIIERVEFDIVAGQEAGFLAYCEANRALFEGMEGCTSFAYGQGVENPSKTILILGWTSVAAHKAAGDAGKIAPFGAGIGPFLAGTPRMEHFDLA